MSFLPWSNSRARRSNRHNRGRIGRLTLETLEDRLALSTVAIVPPSTGLLEGSTIAFTSTLTDVVGTPTYSWTATDGTYTFSGTSESFSFVPPDDGSYQVSLTVTDDNGPVTDTETVVIENVAPENVLISGPTTAVRGQTIQFSGTFTDPGTEDVHTLTWQASDGTTGSGSTFSFTPTAEGEYTVTFTVDDNDGGITSTTATVTVTAVAQLEDGTLMVGGTTGKDTIVFNPKGKQSANGSTIAVKINGKSLGVFTGVTGLVAFGQAGNDNIQVAGSIKVSAELHGDDGNDRIKAGAGDDIVTGDAGDDHVDGGTGNDIVIGGEGADRILGGPGDDILVAGATSFDANTEALNSILEMWTANGSYEDRIGALRKTDNTDGVFLTGASSTSSESTVLDDGAADKLTGTSGRDWFFADELSDSITGRAADELLNDEALPTTPGGGNGGGGKGKGKGKP